ncbi:unnamed protein product [Adineta steineri]|uniref:BZIP domain-containing protein n=1 Tax=Adineta steineri TaxID=433720 RepID=A0A814EJV1_9BILA|nr:unnamed protein product [Adineta steineri]
MDLMYEPDLLFSIDMDELGIRPQKWIDLNKDIDASIDDYFGKEKTIDFTAYSAELQFSNNGKKLTTDEEDSAMSSDDYDIDPETGEKIFRQTALVSDTTLSPSNDKWIEEYLSNIQSSSNQILPTTATTTSSNSELLLEDLPLTLLENTDEQSDSDWLSSIINLDDTSDSIMFTDTILSNQFISENESYPILTAGSSSNENSNESVLINSLNVSIDDDYSMNSNSNNRQHRLYSSLTNDSDISFIETKLEKIDPDDSSMSHMMMVRRSSARSSNQGQQDEDALRQHNIPLTLYDITQSSTEEYNLHLLRLSHLSSEQMHVIKDIRRRGKNKVAAQNCRKRKANSVESLLEEVDELKRVKYELEQQRRVFKQQIDETRLQYEYLHRQVLPDRQLPPAISVN